MLNIMCHQKLKNKPNPTLFSLLRKRTIVSFELSMYIDTFDVSLKHSWRLTASHYTGLSAYRSRALNRLSIVCVLCWKS